MKHAADFTTHARRHGLWLSNVGARAVSQLMDMREAPVVPLTGRDRHNKFWRETRPALGVLIRHGLAVWAGGQYEITAQGADYLLKLEAAGLLAGVPKIREIRAEKRRAA